jgi:GNAT superfamily N-acetyltransferase
MNDEQVDIGPTAGDVIVRLGTLNDFPRIEPLWVALYNNQREQRMLVEVPPNGFESWTSSMSAALGRFTSLFIAECEGEVVGFLAGRLRTMPPYFGGHPVGFLSEIFILEQHRKKGIARRLMLTGLEWCRAQHVSRVEAQVLMDNHASRNMCADLGAVEELVQVVWRVG